MRRLPRGATTWALPALAAWAQIAGCLAPTTAQRDPAPYLNDAAYRRAELEASLVNRQNGYSRLRLEHYATGKNDDWEHLPEWNPVTEPIMAAELDQTGAARAPLSAAAAALTLPDEVSSEDDPALLRLGREAFARYPVQLAPSMSVALASREAAARYGLWIDDERGVGGLVRTRMADGSTVIAWTCSTCHTAKQSSGVEDGAPNSAVDPGKALLDADAANLDAAAAIAAWGPGRLDVTTTAGIEPVRIPDLRPVRFLTHLHQDATLVVRDRTALALRIETLIITSSGQVLRPPRIIALALAAYIASLADTLAPLERAEAASALGARVFADRCASCHVPPTLTGPPASLAEIGTDPSLGLSLERGTGMYRVPSLRGVGSRGPLLHDASVASISVLFDPARLSPGFSGRLHGAGAIPGHAVGLDLSAPDRGALVAYLEML
jgi:hypothetical protein